MSSDEKRSGVLPHNHKGTRNLGHGHVFPRADGARARCGGPGMCSQCSGDQAELHSWAEQLKQPFQHWEPEPNPIDTVVDQVQSALNVEGLKALKRDAALREDFRIAINRNSREGASNTPDHILAAYLVQCLLAFEAAHNNSIQWWGSNPTYGVYTSEALAPPEWKAHDFRTGAIVPQSDLDFAEYRSFGSKASIGCTGTVVTDDSGVSSVQGCDGDHTINDDGVVVCTRGIHADT